MPEAFPMNEQFEAVRTGLPLTEIAGPEDDDTSEKLRSRCHR